MDESSVPETELVPESDGSIGQLSDGLNAAIEAMLKALLALILVLLTLLVRALQAIFILARPAALVACVIAAGYTSATLFRTVLVRYGNDPPAALLALSAVIVVPAALLVLAGDYGVWAVMLAVATLDFLVHLGIERAPPLVVAALPIIGLAGVSMYFLRRGRTESAQEEAQNEQQERDECAAVDSDDESNHLYCHQEL